MRKIIAKYNRNLDRMARKSREERDLVKWRVMEAYHNYIINDDRTLMRFVFHSAEDASVINSVFNISMEEENLLCQERHVDALIQKLEEREL